MIPAGMRDVRHEERAHLVGDLAEGGEIERAGIGAAADDDQLRLVLLGQAPHLCHVYLLSVLVDP